jgi:glucose/mannose transport system permease protein
MVIPLYTIFSQLGLRDTLPGLLIVYPATTLPVALYMLRSYFQTLPKDLEEAGMIDGATRFGVIGRITLPLSLPALASVGLYVFMIAWNEFLFAVTLTRQETQPITVALANLAGGEAVNWNLPMAGSILAALPTLLIYVVLGRYFIRGLLAGSVKG